MPLRKVVISGGGTGGHIFPAIAIANEIRSRYPNCEILFVGAKGKMEMEKVPAAGYDIVGLEVAGFKRKLTLENFKILFKFLKSARVAKKTLKTFNPDVAIGVGGYASGPTLKAAAKLNIPIIIQEQNSFAGLTNKVLGKKAKKICVAYDGMDRFFRKDQIVLTGNPVRNDVVQIEGKKGEAVQYFGLNPDKRTLLVIGGSLGARTINNAVKQAIDDLDKINLQVIWQCGKYYQEDLEKYLSENPQEHIKLNPFISRMDLAYAAADFIVSRAGAISVSEICLIGKPVVLVPSPNVAEDHQTKNAMALVDKDAAVILKDADAVEGLVTTLKELMNDSDKQDSLRTNLVKMAKPNATSHIVDVIEEAIG